MENALLTVSAHSQDLALGPTLPRTEGAPPAIRSGWEWPFAQGVHRTWAFRLACPHTCTPGSLQEPEWRWEESGMGGGWGPTPLA